MTLFQFGLLAFVSLAGCAELERMGEAQAAMHATKIEDYLRVHPDRRQRLVSALNSGIIFDDLTWREMSLVYSAPRPDSKRHPAVFWCGSDTAQRISPSDNCPGARGIFFLSDRDVDFIERRDDQFDRRIVADAGRSGDGLLVKMQNDPHLTYTVAQALLTRTVALNMTRAEIEMMQLRHNTKEKYWCNFAPADACTLACGFCSIVVFVNGNTIYLDNKPTLGVPRVRRIEPFINAHPIP
jgi:hypothetical protein